MKKTSRPKKIEDDLIPFGPNDTQLTSPQVIGEVYDTGIYRDEPKVLYPLKTLRDLQAFEQRTATDAAVLFNLDSLLTEAEGFARKIRERYEDSGGVSRLPSKKDGIPDNVKRQVHYAKKLHSHISVTRAAVKKGEVQTAATYAYWIGRYYEALQVCQIEHVALDGRRHRQRIRDRQIDLNGPPQERVEREHQALHLVATLRKENPNAKAMWIYQEVADKLGLKTPRTIIRYLKNSSEDDKKR